MNVLSLFDGMGCAWIALKELGMKVGKGYSCEIDKFAIMQVEHNFPEVERLGDVTRLDVSALGRIDLLLGGSPCQSFSFSGKRNGMSTVGSEEVCTLGRYLELKRQGFRFEGQSYLFWEYMRILEDIRKYNPDVLFLLENVEMEKKWERVLSDATGIRGVHINSALVSAQNRKRIYWTNIRVRQEGLFGEKYSDIPQPEDRGILLEDVLEEEVDGKYYLPEETVRALTEHLRRNRENGNGFGFRPRTGDEKMNALATRGNDMYDLVCVAMRGREAACLPAGRTGHAGQKKNVQRLEPRTDRKCNALTTVAKDSLVLCMKNGVPRQYRVYGTEGKAPATGANHLGHETRTMEDKDGSHVPMEAERRPGIAGVSVTGRGIRPYKDNGRSFSEFSTIVFPESKGNTVTAQHPGCVISPALQAGRAGYSHDILTGGRIRRLTPRECARLQTIPDWYRWDVSESQQYKMLGNGWTVEVIKHILGFMKKPGER